jgi:hypothetical protein
VESAYVAVLAELVREHSESDRLDPDMREPTVVEREDGSGSLVLPRDQMFEPCRSFRLLEAVPVGYVLVR